MITFKFMRRRSGVTEMWEILVPAHYADPRFGAAMRVDAYEDSFYEVGELVVTHSTDRSEFMLACHFDLTEAERFALVREVTLLVGREVFAIGAEFEPRWVLSDELQDFRPPPPEKS